MPCFRHVHSLLAALRSFIVLPLSGRVRVREGRTEGWAHTPYQREWLRNGGDPFQRIGLKSERATASTIESVRFHRAGGHVMDDSAEAAPREQYPPAPVFAFVDASGDPNLAIEKEGTTPLFVLAAITVAADKLEQVRAAADRVRGRHFQRGEMKSSVVGGNDERRYRIVSDLAPLDFRLLALVVDKARVDRESGLAFKKSFFKYLHEMLFGRLYATHAHTRVIADEHGSPEFMKEFERYVYERAPSELFQRRSFDFLASHKDPLLQVADMFAGTLAHVYEGQGSPTLQEPLRAVLLARVSALIPWPPVLRPLSTLGGEGSEHDRTVREFCLRAAMSFLEQTERSEDDDTRAQHAALRFLLLRFDVNEREYVPTTRLREALADAGVNPPSEQALRSRVIAKLRDKGVIVASSSRGYKVPSRVSDLMDFVNRTDAIVYPMLHRLQRARQDTKGATGGTLDILGEERFAYMQTLLEMPLLHRADEDHADDTQP